MPRLHTIALAIAVCLPLAACGGDDDTETTSTTSSVTTSPDTTPPPATSTTSTAATTSVPTTTSAPASTSSTVPTPVVAWPPADVEFSTPEAVAADFAARVLGRGAVLGAFRAGDQRSGEIEVFASDETGRPIGDARSTLLLRQVSGDDWAVIAAVSEGASITDPITGDVVSGSIDVVGRARGFEANINIRAVAIDDPSTALDEEITLAGSLDQTEPYAVTLDVSDATRGSVVLLIVRGGVGLETDPGDTAVIPVVIG